jgi:GPI ethanolamine phosphate transferase 1
MRIFILNRQEYMRNIEVVDNIVQETEKLFNEYFQDDLTSYVFTADHGMSNIGNHGDGSMCHEYLVNVAIQI